MGQEHKSRIFSSALVLHMGQDQEHPAYLLILVQPESACVVKGAQCSFVDDTRNN